MKEIKAWVSSKFQKDEPRAQVLFRPAEPRARVTRVNSSRLFVPMFTPARERREIPADIEKFVRYCRWYLEANPHKSFIGKSDGSLNDREMGILSRHLELSPVAFFLPNRNHWNLLLSREGNELRVYDPIFGLRTRMVTDGPVFYFKDTGEELKNDYRNRSESVTDMHYKPLPKSVWDYLEEDNYGISEGPLRDIGPIQRDALSCGIYCVYAVKIAKGK